MVILGGFLCGYIRGFSLWLYQRYKTAAEATRLNSSEWEASGLNPIYFLGKTLLKLHFTLQSHPNHSVVV